MNKACFPALLFLVVALTTPASRAQESARHRFSEPPHLYWSRQPRDAFSRVVTRIRSGELKLEGLDDKERLRSLLSALDIPLSSQLLVYSATSFQSGLIHPSNPRALYFNEEVYVGYVPGGRFEVAAIDPDLGPVFQIFRSRTDGRPEVTRSERCMNCHAGRTSWQVPGLVVESVIASSSGGSLDGFRREQVGHTVPLRERFGGWHVTGAHEHGEHLGNLMGEATPEGYRRIAAPPGTLFDWRQYPATTSDLLTHLIHEHQVGFHNLVTLAVYRTRDALEGGQGVLRAEDERVLDEIARRIVRYLLFAQEAELPVGGIKPDPLYQNDFLARRIPTKGGLSLRDLDLRTRLFKYRCSYMIYTPGFASLPKEIKGRVFDQLEQALRETGSGSAFDYLPPEEKRAIRSILRETQVMP